MGGSVLLLTAAEASSEARDLGMAAETEWTFQMIDHVQLAMPEGGEEKAEWFYRDVLGLAVLPKPPAMAARGGRWFERGAVKIHLGVEDDFRPARKAHPAIVVANFDALLARLQSAGVQFRPADDGPGARRGHIDDCFGNRIEIIDPAGG
ncbi:MAG TPA: VOC family protein [Acidimicrobiales bacterium]|nr:VOC family protein [Acidimicrobiales bacterium]